MFFIIVKKYLINDLDSYENYFDIILVKSISRFSRNTVDLIDTVNKLICLRIEVIFNP
ncbi:recombinase family protein [Clostridium botulinum]|uniref:recombinase family protein n=1 Tax=Clostridium botulinum TaxID=1491 RepID=UPI001FA72D8B|nr:recombinase family protein [Clostridium botulinum]